MAALDRAFTSTASQISPRILSISSLTRPLLPSISNSTSQSRSRQQPHRTIKSTFAPRPSQYNQVASLPILSSSHRAALERRQLADTLPHRTGALCIKKGMISIFDPSNGNRRVGTVLQIDRNEVVAVKSVRPHGYWAVQMGAGGKNPENVTRPELGHFAQAGISPKRFVAEFRVRDEEGIKRSPVGMRVRADWFRVGDFVDTRSNSRGMGFAGGMKKHGWSGQPASHGQSLTHRQMGSAGGSQGSGSRVIPGKKMPGRMGNERRTIQNLEILQVDAENGIVVVSGPVAGPKGCLVKIQDALRRKSWPELPPIPEMTAVEEQATQVASAA